MKLLTVILLLAPTYCMAQKIPNRSNVILVKGVTRQQLREYLARSGFTPVDRDPTFLETLPRQYKQIEKGTLKIEASIKDTVVLLRAFFNSIIGYNVVNPYGNRGKRAIHTALYGNSLEAFNIMDSLARTLPGLIEYRKE